jgi:hypothetical protein
MPDNVIPFPAILGPWSPEERRALAEVRAHYDGVPSFRVVQRVLEPGDPMMEFVSEAGITCGVCRIRETYIADMVDAQGHTRMILYEGSSLSDLCAALFRPRLIWVHPTESPP